MVDDHQHYDYADEHHRHYDLEREDDPTGRVEELEGQLRDLARRVGELEEYMRQALTWLERLDRHLQQGQAR